MSATLFKEVSYTLAKLMQDIEMGDIGLPEIQRPFVWPNTKVRDLFDSMYRGFPVGYLLFWANGMTDGHRQIGADYKQKPPHLLVVDGQQRLTSLFAVLKATPVVRGDYRPERISIAFTPTRLPTMPCSSGRTTATSRTRLPQCISRGTLPDYAPMIGNA